MATYSQSVFGVFSGTPYGPKSTEINDAQATALAQGYAQLTGTAFLCKGPDGAQRYYRFDAERSTPANPILTPV